MSRHCPCSRDCLMREASRSELRGNGYMPAANDLQRLADIIGTLVDAAAEYDEIGSEAEMLTTATEFMWWVQREIGGRPYAGLQGSGNVLRAHDLVGLQHQRIR